MTEVQIVASQFDPLIQAVQQLVTTVGYLLLAGFAIIGIGVLGFLWPRR